jgi:hypothetical protein
MEYLKVEWRHDHRDDPVLLYSELDAERWEVRKVEIFRNGQAGWASRQRSREPTALSVEPIPPLSKIAEDAQFAPTTISKEEFKKVWLEATMSR